MKDFWKKLKKKKKGNPILALAPMADVTDYAFREILAKYGKPDVFWTEFISADGLASLKGRKKLLFHLDYSKKQKPIIAQIFGSNIENIYKTAKLIQKLGFDGLDINMGCPDKKIIKQKSGAGMIQNPELAKEIILTAKKGAPKLPISIKTRIGFHKNELETWLPKLLEAKPELIIIHARTKKELSKAPANWNEIKRAVEIRNEIGSETLIFGNGDVVSIEDALLKAKETNCDGIMVGRAVIGNPWFFNITKPPKSKIIKEKIKVALEHTRIYEKKFKNKKNFALMKKFFKAYIEGFLNAKKLREELMKIGNSKEMEKTIKLFLKENKI